MRFRLWCMLLMMSGLAGASPSPTGALPSQAGAATSQAVRDPTEADARLRQAMDARRPGDLPATRPVPKAPRVIRRGFVQVVGQAPEALIEVQGAGIYLVRDGDIVKTSAGTNEATVVLRIRKVAPDGIEIEIGSDTLIVR
jgi:hypothetical protein